MWKLCFLFHVWTRGNRMKLRTAGRGRVLGLNSDPVHFLSWPEGARPQPSGAHDPPTHREGREGRQVSKDITGQRGKYCEILPSSTRGTSTGCQVPLSALGAVDHEDPGSALPGPPLQQAWLTPESSAPWKHPGGASDPELGRRWLEDLEEGQWRCSLVCAP